jgi:pSer/pThr/pTyr-binding forkhead associated (FHA) protein
MFTLIIADKNGAIVDEYSFEDGEFVLGRSQQADIVLPADNVSRRHARLFTSEGRCFIEDLGAANGVWLAGQRITGITELARSAQVRIGDFYLHLEGTALQHTQAANSFARLVPLPGSIGELTELNQQTVLVGRGKDCAIVLQDVSVSRIHAKLTQMPDGRVLVEDLRSSNGTFIGDRRIDHAELHHGDRVRFGTVGYQFLLNGGAEVELPQERSGPSGNRQASRQALLQAAHGAYGGFGHSVTPANAADVAQERRNLLPQVAAVAVILVAIVALVVLVVVAYDRLVAAKQSAAVPVVTLPVAVAPGSALVPAGTVAPTAAAPAPAAPAAAAAAEEAEQLDDLMSRGFDAVSRKQWDDAEALFKRARRIAIANPKVTEALNLITLERRAATRYTEAESAFARKDYATAISYHRMIPSDSAYFPEAKLALQSLAQILELDGDKACADKNQTLCRELYQLAISTGYAGPQVEPKFAKVLGK